MAQTSSAASPGGSPCFPALLTSAAMFLVMWLILRKRSWRDWKLLAKATAMPPEHVAPEPRTVRDLAIGEEAYVDRFAIVTSKRGHRVFVAWDGKTSGTHPKTPILSSRRYEYEGSNGASR